MSKYLELVEGSFTQEHLDKQKNQNPYVAYSINDDKVIYTIISNEEEEIDPTEGFVDLGLSVMWASCNLGAGNPEELGEKYNWGETDEHKIGEKEYGERPNLAEHSYSYVRDAVTVSMKDNPYTKYLHYRIPTAELWQELIDNTTREVYTNSEGRNICKYTSNINGNYIVLPLLMQTEGNNNIYYKTTTPASLAGKEQSNITDGKIIRIFSESGTTSVISDYYDVKSYQNNYVRGICSYPPKTDIIQYGNNISSDSTFVLTSAHSIEITCPEDFTVYFSTTPDFISDPSDENVIGFYKSQKDGNNYYRQISAKELSLGQGNHTYLYARFHCDTPTTISADLWNASSCANQSNLITLDKYYTIAASSKNTIYRIRYADFQGYDLTIKWTGNSRLPMYIADTCDFMLSSTDAHVIWNANIASRGTRTVAASDLDLWASRVGSEGFLYIRFNPTIQGSVLFSIAKSTT